MIFYRDVVGTNILDDSNKILVDVSVVCYFNLVNVWLVVEILECV